MATRRVMACAAAVGAVMLLSACGGTAGQSWRSGSTTSTAAAPPSRSAAAGAVSAWGCTLLTRAQVEKIVGARVTSVRAATPGDWTDVSGCVYRTATKRDLAVEVAQHDTLVGDPALAPPGSPPGTTCLPEEPVTSCTLVLPDGYSLIVISTGPGPIGPTLTLAAGAYATNPMPRA